MKRIAILFGLFVAVMAGVVYGEDFTQASTIIKGIMDKQVAEWNKGNLDGFMAAYWKSDQLIFQSGNTRRLGWETLYNMYKTRYFSGGKVDTLEFTDIEMKPLSSEIILVIGRWKVLTTDKTNKEGLFSLLFKMIDNEWKIILDHSS